MSGLSHNIYRSGPRLVLWVHMKMTKDRAAWINEVLARSFDPEARVEHVGHGRYDFVHRDQRVRIVTGQAVALVLQQEADLSV